MPLGAEKHHQRRWRLKSCKLRGGRHPHEAHQLADMRKHGAGACALTSWGENAKRMSLEGKFGEFARGLKRKIAVEYKFTPATVPFVNRQLAQPCTSVRRESHWQNINASTGVCCRVLRGVAALEAPGRRPDARCHISWQQASACAPTTPLLTRRSGPILSLSLSLSLSRARARALSLYLSQSLSLFLSFSLSLSLSFSLSLSLCMYVFINIYV